MFIKGKKLINKFKQSEDDDPIDMNYTNMYNSDKDIDDNSENEEDTSISQNEQNEYNRLNESIVSNYEDNISDDITQQIDNIDTDSDSEISINKNLHNDSLGSHSEKLTPEVSSVYATSQSLNDMNSTDISSNMISRIFPDGYLKIVIGCMFSGKTTYIIRECKKWQSIGKNVLIINYSLDRRYTNDDKLVSHDRYSTDCVMIDKITPELTKKIELYDVILINEGQFFKDLNQNVRRWCDDMKKIVVVSGLDGDYLRGKFGEILDLIPDCDELIKLKALCSLCRDGTDAPFTWKTKDNSIDKDDVVDIGVDKYIPLCRKHYNKEKLKTVKKTKLI